MRSYLATKGDSLRTSFVRRFTPRLWTVDFPRPMMAAITAPSASTLRVDLSFVTDGDLAGLIWSSADRWSHPLLAYEEVRDYRGCTLAFDWVAGPGLMPLGDINGAVLTIEGRDSSGLPRTWYVRLYNYAKVDGGRVRITLPFDDLEGGFLLPAEVDPVHAADVDRMFVSLVPEGFTGEGLPLPMPVDCWLELREIKVSGRNRSIGIGDAWLPEHPLRIASGYDDSYNQAPERLVEQWRALGYRDIANHYVGMSHYYAVAWDGSRFVADRQATLNASAEVWHLAFFAAAKKAGFRVIVALSYELFDQNAPWEWAQRKASGDRALTGWEPPSTLLSPCNAEAMAWLGAVARHLVARMFGSGLYPWFQVGEPWWWVGPDHAPCFYDDATTAAYQAETGGPAPLITDIRGERTPEETAFLDWLGGRLALSTSLLCSAAREGTVSDVTVSLLFFTPQVLDSASPELWRANMPTGWAAPAFDVLQLEDYDFVVVGDEAGQERGWREVLGKLGYPLEQTHYFSGFVLEGRDAEEQWPRILDAALAAEGRQVADIFLWAWPQIARDGFTTFRIGTETAMEAFHDVEFPLALGFEASGGPEFQTHVARMASGFEQRSVGWAEARMRFDAGLGVRSDRDLQLLTGFFRARKGQAHGFRLRDPLDHATSVGSEAVSAFDVLIGVADGKTLSFPLVKSYGEGDHVASRRITRPIRQTVRISVAGLERTSGWQLEPMGIVRFDDPPALGEEVRAGFLFDVPVRFASDRLDISLSGWRSGDVLSVPMVEIREA